MTFDNSNRKNIREAEKASRLAETNRIAYTKTIMSTAFGRAWMHNLLSQCNIFHTPFVFGAPDITAFKCGAQNLGLQIFGDVAANCPHEYTLMMSEASIKDEVHDQRYSESSDNPERATTGASPRRYSAESS